MGPRAALPDLTYLAVMRSVSRSISYYSLMDLDIADWLTKNPLVEQVTEFPPGLIPDLLTQRITHHVRRRILSSVPLVQQINFDTPGPIFGA